MLAMVWAGGEVFIVSSYIEAITTGESVMQLFVQTLCGIVYAYLLGAIPVQASQGMSTVYFVWNVEILAPTFLFRGRG